MCEKQLVTERGTVHYWIERNKDDNAKCIFFLHGLTASHTLFDKQIEFFRGKYTVLTWDAPSHGKSRPYKEFSYMNMAEDLKSILDNEKITKVILVGQSMGGYIIQRFSVDYSKYIEAFIGIDTCPFGFKYYSKSDMWWLRQIGWMSRLFPYKALVESVAKSCTYNDYSYQNMLESLEVFSSKDELCTLMGNGYRQFDKENCEVNLCFPVMLLVGEHDVTGKVKDYCKAWNENTGFPLYTVENAAHNSNVDNYEKVNKLIDDFLEQKVML